MMPEMNNLEGPKIKKAYLKRPLNVRTLMTKKLSGFMSKGSLKVGLPKVPKISLGISSKISSESPVER